MSNNYKFLLALGLTIFNTKQVVATEPIQIEGYTLLKDLNEQIPFYFNIIDSHPFAYVDIFIFVNNKLEATKHEVSKYVHKEFMYIKGFSNPNERKDIKIEVKYSNENISSSFAYFTIKSPAYQNYVFNNDTINFQEQNPIKTYFEMKGEKQSIYHDFESIEYKGMSDYYLKDSRYLDFSLFSLKVNTIKKEKIDLAEIKIYTEFEGSDLLYKNNSYTTLDIHNKEIDYNHFKGINEYRYYIDERNGTIMQNYNEYCNEDTLPFFIPLSVNSNKDIKFSVTYHDVGINHNSYSFEGIIHLSTNDYSNQFGDIYGFIYKLITPNIEDVTYV